MGDRMDIDALLIGALYGELAPADEARLAAHLESHPADRTALADLTRTRAAVRDSRIFALQLEPPQAVSALLLQEAARRLPKREKTEGWFYRLSRAFMAHPGLATAAMAVVVVGVVGALYVRRGALPMAETAPPAVSTASSGAASDPAGAAAPASTPPSVASVTPAAPAAEPAPALPRAKNYAEEKAAAPKPDVYGVGVVERDRKRDDDAELQVAEGRANQGIAAPTGAKLESNADRPPARLATADSKPAAPSPKGIVIRPRELQPKELDDNRNKDLAKSDSNLRALRAEPGFADKAQAPAAGAGGAVTGDSIAAGPQPPPPAAAPAPPPAEVAQGAAAPADVVDESATLRAQESKKAKAPAKTAPRPAASPPPAPSTAPASRDARFAEKPGAYDGKAAADDSGRDDRTLLSWAAKQHGYVVALVKANNCRAAANAAVEIYNRAPDYYTSNVATDRAIKLCMPYVNSERDRVDRSRAAAKRAYSTDAPAAAPPPVKK